MASPALAESKLFVPVFWREKHAPELHEPVKITHTHYGCEAYPAGRLPVPSTAKPQAYVAVRDMTRDGRVILQHATIVEGPFRDPGAAIPRAQELNDRHRQLTRESSPVAQFPGISPQLREAAAAGLVAVAPQPVDAVRSLIHDWAQLGGLKKPEDHLIVTYQTDSVRHINDWCSAARHVESVAESRTTADFRLFVTDRVVLSHCELEGQDLDGQRGTVLSFDGEHTAIVRLDSGATAQMPLHAGRKFLDLGYAVTAEQAVRFPAQRAYLLYDRQHVEVSPSVRFSTERDQTWTYIDQKRAGADLARLCPKHTLADTHFQKNRITPGIY